ncbi:MAG: putative signal transduction histidine kinase [Bacteroidetes bacterium]|nr:putative signal transduction histidine kinase [Bacteroidota bacterium]
MTFSFKFYILIITLFLGVRSFGQKYNFVNFTVEDGLIQSQAMHIVQDNNRYLWIATEGGLCKFDGKTFVKYSSQDGLASNFINKLLCDKKGNIWIATKKGISVYDGKRFNQILHENAPLGNTTFLCGFSADSIYVLNNFGLGLIVNNHFTKKIIADSNERVTALYISPEKNLLAYVFAKGLYALKHDKWNLVCKAGDELKDVAARNIFITSSNDTLIATAKGLLKAALGTAKHYCLQDGTPLEQNVYCIEQLNEAIWMGTDKGAFKIEKSNLTHFNSKNGLTDNNVYSIFRDQENNLWFASDADGIFKYKENNFSFYDKTFGLVNPTIMGVSQTSDGNIYAADYSGNLYRITAQNKIEPLHLENTEITANKINTIYADNNNNLYIGSLGKKIYCYNIKCGIKVLGDDPEFKLRGSNCFLKDKNENLIIGNAQGLFIINRNDKIRRIETNPATFNAIVEGPNNNILIGNTNGILILDENYKVSSPELKGIENSEILCLKYKDDVAWLGSTEHGVFRWDTKTNKIKQFNVSKGLPSDFIYSLIVRNNNDVWLGTGFGICNLILDNTGEIVDVKNYGRSDGLIGMECNHTSELLANDSTLWFGTTKGLAHFKPSKSRTEIIKPYVILKSVKLFSSPITDSAWCKHFSGWYNIPEGLVLPAKQNHLTFELTGIYLSNPEDILFKYKLEGIDKAYTVNNNPVINYPALPAGIYTLEVYAITKGGVLSSNVIKYSFEILKPYYLQAWFLLMAFLAFGGVIALVIFLYLRKKQKEKMFWERIREEEFTRLRQRTAEDFHDEMGNKLTRISVLTDILKSKVSPEEKDALNIVNQIKENTTALYNGSRDIIWSLNSKNDNFFEIIEHVKSLGHEIFSETNTNFVFDHNVKSSDDLKLKLDYSRNLIMIFKEVYNNILKHSCAQAVRVKVELLNNKEALILINDNGRGFDSEKEHKGNGLKNIQNRIKRINGTFTISSSANNGTEILILLKDIFHI